LYPKQKNCIKKKKKKKKYRKGEEEKKHKKVPEKMEKERNFH